MKNLVKKKQQQNNTNPMTILQILSVLQQRIIRHEKQKMKVNNTLLNKSHLV